MPEASNLVARLGALELRRINVSLAAVGANGCVRDPLDQSHAVKRRRDTPADVGRSRRHGPPGQGPSVIERGVAAGAAVGTWGSRGVSWTHVFRVLEVPAPPHCGDEMTRSTRFIVVERTERRQSLYKNPLATLKCCEVSRGKIAAWLSQAGSVGRLIQG